MAALASDDAKTLMLPDGSEAQYHWHLGGQHTLMWSKPLRLTQNKITTVVAPGSCCLYAYPFVTHPQPQPATTPAQLQVVATVIKTLVNESLFNEPDASGATPVLALGVANSPEALELLVDLYKLRPNLLVQSHLPGPFVGENAFHVMAVNRQEDTLCTMIQLAHDHLSRPELELCFWAQASGAFFLSEPMASYGGTPLSFAATFCLRRAIALLLSLSLRSKQDKMKGIVDTNSPKHACMRSGLMPLHATVANGKAAMYDWLTELPGLPLLVDFRASEEALTRRGTLSQFTPLQLACFLGDQSMFRHLLSRRSRVEWRWGPLTQKRIALHGIDSVGGGANDVLEVIGRLDARRSTQEMLLDDFLEGFLHTLFVDKWRRFGRAVHALLRLLELIYVAPLLWLTLWLKEYPDTCLEHGMPALPLAVLVLAMPTLFVDVGSLLLYWWKLRESILDETAEEHQRRSLVLQESFTGGKQASMGEGHESVRADLAKLGRWAASHQMPMKLGGCLLGCLGAVILLSGYKPAIEVDDARPSGWPLWTILALSLLMSLQSFFSGLLIPAQKLGVFFYTALRVIANDVSVFAVLSLIFFFTYGLTCYVAYPRAGAHVSTYAPNFNGFLSGMHELLALALLGEPSTYVLPDGVPASESGWYALMSAAVNGRPLDPYAHPTGPHEWVEIIVFAGLYLVYLILSCVLLLNLLIAMMNFTFVDAQTEAVLEWRVLYARNILRLEMLAEAFTSSGCLKFDTYGGERAPDGVCYVTNREHDRGAYGDDDGGTGRHVGLFGARDPADIAALNAYIATFELERDDLDGAATRVQQIFRGRHTRRLATTKRVRPSEAGAGAHGVKKKTGRTLPPAQPVPSVLDLSC